MTCARCPAKDTTCAFSVFNVETLQAFWRYNMLDQKAHTHVTWHSSSWNSVQLFPSSSGCWMPMAKMVFDNLESSAAKDSQTIEEILFNTMTYCRSMTFIPKYSECLTLKLEFSNWKCFFLHFCIILPWSRAWSSWLVMMMMRRRWNSLVLVQDACVMSWITPECSAATQFAATRFFFFSDKSKEEIMEGIQKAVQLVKDHDASWLIIYYAGHSFWDKLTKEIVIEPKADGGEIRLEKQVKLTVHNAELEYIQITIFVGQLSGRGARWGRSWGKRWLST